MPVKVYEIAGLGPVQFIKNNRSRSIRLSVTNKGIRVSLPRWTPYSAAIAFVEQQKTWIIAEQAKKASPLLQQGQKIGKLHVLQFEKVAITSATSTRVTPTRLLIRHHADESYQDSTVQLRANNGAVRALKKESSVLLPPRLRELAQKHGFVYKSCHIKQLTRRWGSCDNHGNITLSLYLMQLSWQQIDYVLCHELTHTQHMNHSGDFWNRLCQVMPDARMIAKVVRRIQPALTPVEGTTDLADDMTY